MIESLDFRQFFERHRSPMMIVEPAGGYILMLNGSACRLFGLDSSAQVELSNLLEFPNMDIPTLRKRLLKDDYTFFCLARTPGGETYSMDVESTVFDLPDGRRACFFVMHDSTAKNLFHEKLKEIERRYLALFNSALIGVALLNSEARLIKCNETFCRMTGYTERELEGRPLKDISHSDEIGENLNLFERAKKREITDYQMEKKYIRKDGSTFWGDLRVFAFHNPAGEFEYCFAMIMDISARKLMEQELSAAVERKDLLLSEVHHRVKNNMQLMISLLKLQAQFTPNEQVRSMLLDSQNRVLSMALVHELIYGYGDFSKVEMKKYIYSLTTRLKRLYLGDESQIEIDCLADDILLGVDTAIPCGLLINEIVTNSMRHAFPGGRKGRLMVSLGRKGETYELVVKDDGVGLAELPDFNKGNTLGILLINSLLEQLEARIQIQSGGGTEFRIVFEELFYKNRI